MRRIKKDMTLDTVFLFCTKGHIFFVLRGKPRFFYAKGEMLLPKEKERSIIEKTEKGARTVKKDGFLPRPGPILLLKRGKEI